MLRAILLDLPVGQIRKAMKSAWFRRFVNILGLAAFMAAIWFGFPMTGVGWLAQLWVRLAAMGLVLAVLALVYGLSWRARRRNAAALEDSLVRLPAGDGGVLAERMQEALTKLKKTGGKNYLYDLPWYIIIGPPGAGKTTALRNAGIEFPGADSLQDAAQGFGGTRNCDWWFAEDAVLIDTAGRYTTQDSDAEADRNSWASFLDLLKRGRPDQPINGVILAFSVEDMMTASPETLTRHAETVRTRLAEIHEALRIDFPVYVLFTKADLISGFREYFASFNLSRRKGVWGVTFQTRDRAAPTFKEVPAEFDRLLGRLSDEIIDRMNEEPDGISRIAIFGLPGQMALLRDNIGDFIRRIFEPTRYKSNAILRGFYFTSGTQEGTPIDQVLGAMARNEGMAGFQPAFMSGKGKSFFLHDLLKKVIIEERDWVGFDRRAIRRGVILRSIALASIGIVTLGSMSAFGYSFWRNASLIVAADRTSAVYADTARNELGRTVIDDTDPSVVMVHLQDLRQVATGYGDTREPTFWDGLGLSRHKEMAIESRRAYSDGLERMLRPRMVLHLENALPQLIANGDTAGIYRALKVYILLGGQGEGGNTADNDAAIVSFFDETYRQQFNGPGQGDVRDRLLSHVAAMLELDGDRSPTLKIDPEIVASARESIVNLPLAEQAYASIKDRAALSGVSDFNLVQRIQGSVADVLTTTDGSQLDMVGVPGMFTFEGYWGYFLEELTLSRDRLREDQWVLGDAATRVGYEEQLQNLERELHRLYRLEFSAAWGQLLQQVGLARMSADAPEFAALAAASSAVASPILELVEAVDEETRLTRLYDQIESISAEEIAAGSAEGNLGERLGDAALARVYSRSGVFQRVILDSVAERGKAQNRVGGAVEEDSQRRQVERITEDFAQWHALLKGESGLRPIDLILLNLRDLRENRRQSAQAPTPADETMLNQFLSTLTMNNTALPEPLAVMLNKVDGEFRSIAQDATLAQMNRALNDEITAFCKDLIEPLFPFGQGRHVSPSVFGQFFGHGGRMDTFFTTYLQPHVLRSSRGLQAAPESTIGQRLSGATLTQFDRAEAIRLAFFASGAMEPNVGMSVAHLTSSPTVDLAVLSINGASIQTQPNSTPARLDWPGAAAGVALELFPAERGRESSMNMVDGRWDIVTFLRQGRTKVSGNVADVTQDIGGRSITYRIEFDSTTVPFLMPELRDFACPTSLE